MSRTPRPLAFQIASIALVLLALGAGRDARSQLANVPFDSNGNGTLDVVVVDGDYDGDGHVEPEDIQAAVHDLNGRLPGEEGRAIVLAGDYVEVCRGPGDPGGYCAGDRYLACDPIAGIADCVAAGLSGSDATCESIACQGWDTRSYAGT